MTTQFGTADARSLAPSHTEEGSFVAPGGLGHDGHVHEKGRKPGGQRQRASPSPRISKVPPPPSLISDITDRLVHRFKLSIRSTHQQSNTNLAFLLKTSKVRDSRTCIESLYPMSLNKGESARALGKKMCRKSRNCRRDPWRTSGRNRARTRTKESATRRRAASPSVTLQCRGEGRKAVTRKERHYR